MKDLSEKQSQPGQPKEQRLIQVILITQETFVYVGSQVGFAPEAEFKTLM